MNHCIRGLIICLLTLFAAIAKGETITWNVTGVANTFTSKNGEVVNTSLTTDNDVSGTWNVLSTNKSAASNGNGFARLGNNTNNLAFNGTISLTNTVIPANATIQEVAIVASTNDSYSYNVSISVNNSAFGDFSVQTYNDATFAAKNSIVGNSVVIALSTTSTKAFCINSISITYSTSAPEPHTVTLGDDNTELVETGVGSGVTLPVREDVGVYHFQGWTESVLSAETTEAPTLVADNYTPSGDVTLYPVYHKTVGEGTWTEVTDVPLKDGDYAICTVNGFMTGVISGTRLENSSVKPIIANGTLVDAPADDCVWTIEKNSSGYYLKHNDKRLIGSVSGSTYGLSFGSTSYAWTITKDDNGLSISMKSYPSRNIRQNETKWAIYSGAINGNSPRLFRRSDTEEFYTSTPVAETGTVAFVATDGTDRWATFSAFTPTRFSSEDVAAYAVCVENGGIVLTEIEPNGTNIGIPAHTGVLLKSKSESAQYTIVDRCEELGGLNMLRPAYGEIFAEETNVLYYKLAYDDYATKSALGFYWGAEDGKPFKAKTGTAYLAVPQTTISPNIAGYSLDGTSTAITDIRVLDSDKAYDLNGRPAPLPRHGLYIFGNKKAYIK